MELPPNFRDVSTITNRYSRRIRLRPHTFYRSSLLHPRYHGSLPPFQTHIDLRTSTELGALPPSTSPAAAAAQPAFTRIPHSLLTRRYKVHLVLQLGLLHMLTLLCVLLFWPRAEGRVRAARLIGREVLAPMGLSGVSRLGLRFSGRELAGVLREIVYSMKKGERGEAVKWGEGAVCVTCTAGKDRTGLVVVLAMLICGVEEGVVVREYTASDAEIMGEGGEEVRREMMAVGGIGLDFCRAPESVARDIMEELKTRWGGVEGWCDEAGFGRLEREELKRALVEWEADDGGAKEALVEEVEKVGEE